MKELSIEEKAKAYDEAIKRASNLHKDAVEMENSMVAKTCEIIFPELKESGDERIRKELIQYLKDYPNLPNGSYCRDDFFAWLEKQGAKVSAIEGFETEFERQVSYLIASVISKEYGYNQGYVKWTANALLNYARHELEKQGEQKLAWSEEDEKKIAYLIALLQNSTMHNSALSAANEGLEDWLKSLKNKVQPQPKQEWSEEDEKFVHGLIRGLSAKRDIYRHTTFSSDCIDITETINWLESLKSRVLLYPVSVEYNEEDIDNIADMFIPEPVWNALEESEGEGSNAAAYDYSQMIAMFKAGVHWLKSLKDSVQPQNLTVTDEELSQAKKDAYNDALNKIEYHNGEPTFDDGWSAAIWYLKKKKCSTSGHLETE